MADITDCLCLDQSEDDGEGKRADDNERVVPKVDEGKGESKADDQKGPESAADGDQ